LYKLFEESDVNFMSMICGHPQGRQAHVDACGQGGIKNLDFLMDIISG